MVVLVVVVVVVGGGRCSPAARAVSTQRHHGLHFRAATGKGASGAKASHPAPGVVFAERAAVRRRPPSASALLPDPLPDHHPPIPSLSSARSARQLQRPTFRRLLLMHGDCTGAPCVDLDKGLSPS